MPMPSPPPTPPPEPPQLHGVVIITLPPPAPPRDQPSKGKTITAFTYTDEPGAGAPPPPQHRGPPMAPAGRETRRSRRAAAMVLVLGALVLAAYYSLYSDVAVQFLGMEEEEAQRERNETKSFLFQLYPKAHQGRALREFGDIKLTAKWVDDGGGTKVTKKLDVKGATSAGTNSTVLLPKH